MPNFLEWLFRFVKKGIYKDNHDKASLDKELLKIFNYILP